MPTSGRSNKSSRGNQRSRRGNSDREMLDTGRGGKRFARRDAQGQFSDQDSVSRSLPRDRQQRARKGVRSGQGDRGDQRR